MQLELDNAKYYFLISSDTDSRHYIGTPMEMNYMASIMDESEYLGDGGIAGEECYILVPWTDEECIQKIKEMKIKMTTVIPDVSEKVLDG